MNEPKTLDKRIYDAAKAKEVLDNEAFQSAFDDIRKEYTEAWMNSPARDVEAREKLYLMLQLTNKLQATLTGMVADGTQANIQREHEANLLAKQRAYGLSQSNDPYAPD